MAAAIERQTLAGKGRMRAIDFPLVLASAAGATRPLRASERQPRHWLPLLGLLIVAAIRPVQAAGDPKAGQEVFRVCAACHTLEPGAHRTGPSLAGVFGRKAGTAAGFHRYSEAIRSVDLVWREDTLDAFLTDPQGFLPGNRMTFPGIEERPVRADLIAFLQTLSAGGVQAEAEGPPAQEDQGGMMGGMMGASGNLQDLKTLGRDQQVTAIRYCGDTYHVTTATGEALPFWEFNLRFKTDSSDKGPQPGRPVLLPASMMGDRAFVIFAAPEEISASIEAKC
jgi:cytochrome c